MSGIRHSKCGITESKVQLEKVKCWTTDKQVSSYRQRSVGLQMCKYGITGVQVWD